MYRLHCNRRADTVKSRWVIYPRCRIGPGQHDILWAERIRFSGGRRRWCSPVRKTIWLGGVTARFLIGVPVQVTARIGAYHHEERSC